MLMACVSRPLTTCDAWLCVVDFCAVELLRRCFWQQKCRTQLRGDVRTAVVVHFLAAAAAVAVVVVVTMTKQLTQPQGSC